MKQTVTVTPKVAEKEVREYPYYAKSENGCVVFFIKKDTGVCIWPKSNMAYGTYCNEEQYLIDSNFTPIVGTITITQE